MGDSVGMHSYGYDQAGTSRHPDDRYFDAFVMYVDLIDHTFRAVSMDHSVDFPAVHFVELEVSGSGEIRYPVCGDHIVVRVNQTGSAFLDSYMTIPAGKNEFKTSKYAWDKKPYLHPYLKKKKWLTGDRHWFGMAGSFLQFLRGGITRIGASPLCQTIFIKFENTWRTICQNFQFWSNGVNAVSNNNNGEIETRLSLFTKDIWGWTHDQTWADRADFDILVDKNGLTLLFGPVINNVRPDEVGDWQRTNRTIVRLKTNSDLGEEAGTVFIGTGKDITDKKYRQTFEITPTGTFVHKQYDPDFTKETYNRQVIQKGDTTDVDERITGNYRLSASENISIKAGLRLSLEGERVDTTAKIAITENGPLHGINTTSRY